MSLASIAPPPPKTTEYMPITMTARQAAFLSAGDILEVLYGGAAGGGKSWALLMAALQYADHPDYTAILLRRTYKDLALPEALLDISHQILGPTDARWRAKDYTYVFPSGAKLVFGYLEHDRDKYRYQSAAFQYIGFDELTQFSESQYTYLFSRLRKVEGSDVPLRMRTASNPGGVGHRWVMDRFQPHVRHNPNRPRHPDRRFLSAKLEDNDFLDKESYRRSLSKLDPVTREQLEKGRWDVKPVGEYFRREWVDIVGYLPEMDRWIRYWDLAATKKTKGNEPCWTVGALWGVRRGAFVVANVRRLRDTPYKTDLEIRKTADEDGPGVEIWFEQEPGSAGIRVIESFRCDLLKDRIVRAHRPTGDKLTRFKLVSSKAEAGDVSLVDGPWVPAWLDEHEVAFTEHQVFLDQVDTSSGSVAVFTMGGWDDLDKPLDAGVH